MEPLNATVLYTADRCDVWTGTQDGELAFTTVVQASGLPAEKCDVHKVMLGGGFGRRGVPDYIRQAVVIAKQMLGTPVPCSTPSPSESAGQSPRRKACFVASRK
jgi:isoquinoline 1-oxidoreductase beta subunit